MDNIQTLLAAVAQTQGFDDDDDDEQKQQALDVNASPLGFQNSPSSSVQMDVPQPQLTPSSEDEWSGLDLYPLPLVTVPAIGSGEKRKRGRPPRGQGVAPPQKRIKQEDEEEDVCFICFDGGSLVLCDKKGCPKAYHPACIKRDEAFFNTKAKWNCGWHICSVCRKGSHYVCYTCTYSLCKGCTKDADYLCVRGNKGFCSTCMKTIMLIENKDQANEDSVKVDFDDITSWEYLFKVYWVCLKEKLSLTLMELTQAKKPWKGVTAMACKLESRNMHHTALDGNVSISLRSSEHLKSDPHESQTDGSKKGASGIGNHVETINSVKEEDVPSYNNDTQNSSINIFTADKGADESGIQISVDKPGIETDGNNAIIVEDINRPFICRNSDEPKDNEPEKPEICNRTEWASKDLLEFVAHMKNGDTSALSLFDVQLLLIDYIKRYNLRDPRRKNQIICDLRLTNLFGRARVGNVEMLKLLESHLFLKEDPQNYFIPAGYVGSFDTDVDGNNDGPTVPIKSKKQKMCKKNEVRSPQNNLNENAAIDFHNINLIYLRRNLMENLIEDKENFSEMVVGSIVRIRISSNDQKPDVHRLVQVVGTRKAAEPYKLGDKTTDIMLEVLNLDNKEAISVDSISDQNFTEDECRRLRQGIRCGLMKQFTVGEIQNKAIALQPVRLNDWLESEKLRLNHLRDQASEKGRKKELREYVHKSQLLESPEECQRRISELPIIHADPKMNPSYYSEEDTRSIDKSKDEHPGPSYSGFAQSGRKPISSCNKGKENSSIQAPNQMVEHKDANGCHSLQKQLNQVGINNSAIGVGNDQAMQRSGLQTSVVTASSGNSPSTDHIEIEKMWYYCDPNGKTQGPFTMMQLQKWSRTGVFPPNMRIWRNHEQFDSLLLIDAFDGQFPGASEQPHNSLDTQKDGTTGCVGVSQGIKETGRDSKQTEATSSRYGVDMSETNSGSVRADETCSPAWPQCWDLLKDENNSTADHVQACTVLPSTSPGQTSADPSDRCQEGVDLNHELQNGEKNSSALSQNQMISGQLKIESDNKGQVLLSSEENLRTLPIDLMSSNDIQSESVSAPTSRSDDAFKVDCRLDVPVLHNHTPRTSNEHSVVLNAEKELCLSPDCPDQTTGFLELLSLAPRSNNEGQGVQETERKRSGLIDFLMSNPGPSWNSSSLVVSAQLPEVADEWSGYSPRPAKPPVQEWEPGVVSASSLRPPEVTGVNVANSNSNNSQFIHASTSHPPPNSWLAMLNEPIEFDALGEESVSDLLAEVDAMEFHGGFSSPNSDMKFAREFIQESKDDCFSSIEDFSSTTYPGKNNVLSSSGEVQFTSQSAGECNLNEATHSDALDSFRRSGAYSSASSEAETNAPVFSREAGSEFHPPAPNVSHDMVGAAMAPGTGSEFMDSGWGNVQGNINLVTVQGNVNLVLGGHTQEMANMGWGTNPGAAWMNPNINRNPINGSLPWDNQRMYGGERFASPSERGYQSSESGYGRGRPPWSRQPYSGSGFSRPPPKGQRICKFYESGRCKKGAFCDYLHP